MELPKNEAKILKKARKMIEKGDFRDALPKIEAILADYPDHPDALQAAVDCLCGLGKPEAALRAAGYLWKLTPEDPVVWNNIGYCYSELGFPALAEVFYSKVLEEAPAPYPPEELAIHRANLLSTLMRQDRVPDSLALINRALTDTPTHGVFLYAAARLDYEIATDKCKTYRQDLEPEERAEMLRRALTRLTAAYRTKEAMEFTTLDQGIRDLHAEISRILGAASTTLSRTTTSHGNS